ncbi:radical SAM protein [Thermoanaerobacterium thermosaccharolyticum]|uniref:Putative Fe-S oxidoreductase n=1 Tax=Thermoanaerobacterium thermosaccharolyticum M0795 TaxID=698948 RepID=L0IG23_THETR|nr:radical SAM protein [Thermoanaerobacterium thermosaccharolyticum]AGB18485.1 putative Fe-S oxidoreductase [Thermoanaerobacterium thermosaccharolyticum M0795]
MGIKSDLQAVALRKAYEFVDRDPETNIPKLVYFLDKFIPPGILDEQIDAVKKVISETESNWYKYIMSLWTDIDDDVRKKIFENFVINASLKWGDINEELQEKYNCNIPWALLIDPTSACNLQCTGCWAAEYGNKLNLTYNELNNIICQAKELGVRFFLYSGGEPLVRKADIIRLCETHPDCQFSAFTNGTLIDEAFADEMLRVKNFIPAISVEGFEEDTDFRRGIGTFKKVEKAMSILKAKRLPFGISCCYTSKNVHIIGSEEYFDQMIEWGAKFCWFFTYMPIGNSAVPELMVSAEQRKFMYEQVRKFRGTKPLFTLDFWNDGEYVDGCIAGGRRYLHVNANGDIEPCAFIHYSDSNIREKTLLEALQSPLFMAYHDRQPFNENHLRPCPLLDNPDALVEMVETSGAHSTDLENPEDVHRLSAKCKIPAENWEPVADELWKCTGHCSACNKSKLA